MSACIERHSRKLPAQVAGEAQKRHAKEGHNKTITTRHVIFGTGAAYQTLGLPYSQWAAKFPALQAAVLAAAEANGARLVSVENVSMYGRPHGRPLTENTAYAAHTKKVRLRGRMAVTCSPPTKPAALPDRNREQARNSAQSATRPVGLD
ncbi:MAG: hypothetical protein QOE51_2290 [Actinoplanes sp.]|jgi:hypothetical protein|nr:hypothetical protein [Actinoplanes sp.]